MTSTNKRWLVFGGIGLTGLLCLVAVCLGGVFFDDDDDPTGYIRRHYQRDATLDRSFGADAYRSDSRSPASVVADLRDHTDERDHRRASGVHFLQYDEHIVAVEDHRTRTVIHIDDYRDGYRHYSSAYPGFVLFGWSSSPPRTGGFFGGGGGFGK